VKNPVTDIVDIIISSTAINLGSKNAKITVAKIIFSGLSAKITGFAVL